MYDINYASVQDKTNSHLTKETLVKKILIVDDNKDVTDVISDFLENKYECIVYNESLNGLKRFIQNNIDLLIIDKRMPAMSGKELFTKVRKKNFKIPIIMITGVPDMDDDFIYGCTENCEFLEKPFTRNQLLEKIKSLLQE